MAEEPTGTGGTDAARLRAYAHRLRARLDDPAATDVSAYARLVEDGERRPWTAAAQRAWQDGGGEWRTHHLAIAHHSRAYDLEATGDPAAMDHWAAALEHWAALHSDDDFWARMAAHLATVMPGHDVTPAVGRVRARLPRDLLAPHVTRAIELRESDPGRARAHVDLIRRGDFGAAAADRARADLVRSAVRGGTAAAHGGGYDGAITDLGSWLRIDPTNPGLVRALLVAAAVWLEAMAVHDDWAERARPLMRTVDELLRPYTDERGDAAPAPDIAPELARYAYWHGRRLLESESAAARAASIAAPALRAAIRHFERARTLDPGQGPRVDGLYAKALVMAARYAVDADPGAARRQATAVSRIDEAHWTVRAAGAEVLLALGTAGDIATARALLDRAGAEATSADGDERAWLRRLRARLGQPPSEPDASPDAAMTFGFTPPRPKPPEPPVEPPPEAAPDPLPPEKGPPVPPLYDPATAAEGLRCAASGDVLEWITHHMPFDLAGAVRAHRMIDAVGGEQAADASWPHDAAILHRIVRAATVDEGEGR